MKEQDHRLFSQAKDGCVSKERVDDVAMQVEEDRIYSFMGTTDVQHTAEIIEHHFLIHTIVGKMLSYYPNKLSLIEKLLPADINSQQTFAL